MPKQLLIVESPAKSKTIGKFLGSDYVVKSSYGHIRDLKTSGMGIDIEGGFVPQYEVTEDKEKLVSDLQKAAKGASKVWLASDEDREGEAIAWHLAETLGLDEKEKNRIVFHEITERAIKNALKSPRAIDLNLVDAQQARRVLDRIVGFELSPILWKKIRPNLSAGRVQSVAVRLVVERERERQDFEVKSDFRVTAKLKAGDAEFVAEVPESARPKDAEAARALLERLKGDTLRVVSVTVKPGALRPAPPFTTSTLQQEASRKLGYSVSETMRLAQKLYEEGHITYMRTDSVNLSDEAKEDIEAVVTKDFGKNYLSLRNYHTTSKGAQEAHEAIRPTHFGVLAAGTSAKEKNLYRLIRTRAMASQMAEAEVERTLVSLEGEKNGVPFSAKGEVLLFDGFLKAYSADKKKNTVSDEDEEDTEREAETAPESNLLPKMQKGDTPALLGATATERFSQLPARYTEASLVKKMEELGIGRPSTYAPTIQTIQRREYVEKRSSEGKETPYVVLTLDKNNRIKETRKSTFVGKDSGKLVPTDTGIIVTQFLTEAFPKVLDYNFTAEVEKKFDDIAEGHTEWREMIGAFYALFHEHVEEVNATKTTRKIGERKLGKDPKSGEPVFAKIGRFGPMIQIGEVTDDGPKPRFSSIPKEMSLETITLEEALKLFILPRDLGEKDGVTYQANNGRFGPYVRYGLNKFVSIPKDTSPFTITLEEAVALAKAKEEAEAKKVIKTFGEGAEMVEVLNGRFGPYIKYDGGNYKIPKGTDAEKMGEDEVRALIANSEPTGRGRKKATDRTDKKTPKKTTAGSRKKTVGKTTKK